MRICVLGGSGDMALAALKLLNEEKDVAEFVIADINEKKAQEISETFAPKAKPLKVNALDHASLVASLKGFNAAMGFIGPFYMFEEKIAAACIEARVPYISICDDYDAYLNVIRLHDKAKASGVTVITGLGNSPGITNLLAKKGYLSMEKPEKIHVQWAGGSDEDIGPANIKHVMHIFSGTTLQWLNGQSVRVRTGTARKTVEFLPPIGKLPVYYTGHAESVSIPMNLKGLHEVTLHGGIHPPYIARLAILFGNLRLTTTPTRRDIMTKIMLRLTGLFAKGGVDKSVFRVDVYGEHQGEKRHHYYTGEGHIAEITSMPAVEGTLMAARGEITEPGVFAPEAIFNADDFLSRLKRRGLHIEFHE